MGSAVLLSACASAPEPVKITREECEGADWQAVGLADGLAGSPDRFRLYRKVCAPYGVEVDEALYRQGRVAGIKAYCTPQGGGIAGENRAKYQGVCPPETEAAFRKAYAQGELRREMADIQQELRQIRERTRKLLEQMRAAAYVESQAATAGAADPAAAADAAGTIAAADNLTGSVRQQLRQLRLRREALQARLQEIRGKVTITDLD